MTKTTKKTSGKKKRGLLAKTGILYGTLIAAALGTVQNANANANQKFYDLYFAQGYGWCDARKLGKIFRVGPGEAKLIAGRKISVGNLAGVQDAWREGVAFFQKHGFTCGSSSLKNNSMERYAYNDAERVSKAWTGSSKG